MTAPASPQHLAPQDLDPQHLDPEHLDPEHLAPEHLAPEHLADLPDPDALPRQDQEEDDGGPDDGEYRGRGRERVWKRAPRPAALTARQRRVLEVIRDSVERRGYPPSIREIGEEVGLTSTSSVSHQLSMLQRKGYLRRDPHRPRAVDVRLPDEGPFPAPDSPPVPAAQRGAGAREQRASMAADGHGEATARETAFVPLVGRIAAGTPVLAEQSVDAVLPLPRDLVGRGELFSLRVTGDSMVDGGIFDGDLVVVRRQQVAEQGDVVAAMVDGEATVKRLYRRDGHVWLMPQNAAYPPIPGDEAQVLGRVVSVLRRL